MEETRELNMSGTELVSEHGRTTIADTVVGKIAGIAAKEIDGVHELLGHGMGDTIAGIAQRVTRSETRGQGVRVDVEGGTATVDLRITTEYGLGIVQIADAIRRNIINRVRTMTGLQVKEVNIHIVDLFFPEEERAEEQRKVA